MLRYRLLGPLRAESCDGAVDLGPPKRRAVLAVLLLARGRVVSTDRLIEAVWGDNPPSDSVASLQVHVSNLRKVLRPASGAPSPIVRRTPGYLIDLEAEEIDVTVFENNCLAARAATASGRWEDALSAARTALALWYGPLLQDLGDEQWVRQEAVHLDEMRIDCMENEVAALLALDRVADALSEVARLRAVEPLRERACWLHMLSLYRAGRGADALDVFARQSAMLADELGLDVGPDLRDLQTAILRHAPELTAWPGPPTAEHTTNAPMSVQTPTADAGRRIKLVGRRAELSSIVDILGDSSAGAARWVILNGPPGIGKTRLAAEAIDGFAAAGGNVVWTACADEQCSPPWWAVRQLIRALGADADEVLPFAAGGSDSVRFEAYERIQSLLEQSSPRPLVVVIDDAQWADATSTVCLAYLAGALRNHPITFVVTVRDGEHNHELERLMAAAARGIGNRRIKVTGLTPQDVRLLANQVASHVVTDSEAAELAHRTAGNPFFVLEFARLPREDWDTAIPQGVRSLLKRRLSDLNPKALEVLRAAAAIGNKIDFDVLATATGLDRDTLVMCLDEAIVEQIVVGPRDGNGYSFAHGLLRDELVASTPEVPPEKWTRGYAACVAASNDCS